MGRFVPDTEAHLRARQRELTAAGPGRSDSERLEAEEAEAELTYEEWLRKKTTLSVDLEINIQVRRPRLARAGRTLKPMKPENPRPPYFRFVEGKYLPTGSRRWVSGALGLRR